ncbi:MAG: NAD(P)H-binding protein [Myxococcota bacterium]
MKIVVLGANGRTGRQLLRFALKSGASVTALVRSVDRLTDMHHERLRVRVGSACDATTIRATIEGHDVVISALGPRWPTQAATSVYPESGAAIVEAMERSGVDRLLVTSSALLFPDDSFFVRSLRWLVPNVVDGARRMEEQIQASNLNWTIVRTSFLTDGSSTDYRLGRGTLPEGGGAVSRAAVASFLLAEAERAAFAREIVGLCGRKDVAGVSVGDAQTRWGRES